MVDLQVQLQVLGLPKSGLKETLVQRLHDAVQKQKVAPKGTVEKEAGASAQDETAGQPPFLSPAVKGSKRSKVKSGDEDEQPPHVPLAGRSAGEGGESSSAPAQNRRASGGPRSEQFLRALSARIAGGASERASGAAPPDGDDADRVRQSVGHGDSPAESVRRGSRVGSYALAGGGAEGGQEGSGEMQDYLSRLKRASNGQNQPESQGFPSRDQSGGVRDRRAIAQGLRAQGFNGRSVDAQDARLSAWGAPDMVSSSSSSSDSRRGGGTAAPFEPQVNARTLKKPALGPARQTPIAPATAPGATAKPRTLLPLDRPRPSREEGSVSSSGNDGTIRSFGQWLPRSSHPQVQLKHTPPSSPFHFLTPYPADYLA